MADIVDRKTRSRMMSGIRGRNTSPELLVRQYLFRAGFRYRLHVPGIPGRPDIVLPARKCVIFVHGCFWHRHPGCRFAYMPRSNVAFWKRKFESNVRRDRHVQTMLRRAGWRVHVIWECEIHERGLRRLKRALGARR